MARSIRSGLGLWGEGAPVAHIVGNGAKQSYREASRQLKRPAWTPHSVSPRRRGSINSGVSASTQGSEHLDPRLRGDTKSFQQPARAGMTTIDLVVAVRWHA